MTCFCFSKNTLIWLFAFEVRVWRTKLQSLYHWRVYYQRHIVTFKNREITVWYNFVDQDTACWKSTVNWKCLDGIITVDKAVWETSQTCGITYTSFKSYNVKNRIKTTCENRRNCSFIANDHTFGEACSESHSRCTIFDYVYTCSSKCYISWITE